MDVAVIGSGISGLSMGQLLKPHAIVTLYETKSKSGGLIKCDRVNDCLFHKVGGHVFNSKNQEVLAWFWSFFDRDKEFVSVKRKAKIYFEQQIIGYPIENYIYKLERPLVKKIIAELVELQKQPAKSPFDYDNFEQFLKASFGETLFDIYFGPYNKKIWQTDLSKVAMQWLEGKLPMPNYTDIIYSNFIREENDDMVHSTFFYPKNEGSQFIADRFSQGLNILRDNAVNPIKIADGKLTIANKNYDKLVYTGDIRSVPAEIRDLLISNGVDWGLVAALKSNGTSNLFCETDDTDISWLYIPQSFTKAHRIIYTGNFSDTNNRGSNRKTCVVEFSGQVDYTVMVKEIEKLPGNLTPLASNYEPNSYVIQDKNTRGLISQIKIILEQHNIYLLGRFAEWEYYNMDKAMEAAFALKTKLVN
ncbi:MAG: NAD(P)-binding protein [Mucilaginibacter sp.]